MSSEAKKWIKEKFTNQYALADKLGWQRSKVSKLLTGRQEWSEDDVLEVAKLTGSSPVTLSRILRGKDIIGDPYQYNYVRSWGPDTNNRSPDPDTWVEKAEWRFPRFFMKALGFIEDMDESNYKVWWVRGHANSPRYCEGDFLIINTALDTLQGSGDYLVDMGGYADSRGIEQYRDEDDIERWHLTSYNPDYPNRIVKPRSYRILGGIVGQMRSV